MSLTINKEAILKFDRPGPRYTSYPTAPTWTNAVNQKVYIEKLRAFGQSDKTLSLYMHIPFCQTLCSFCACNVIIRPHEDKYGNEYLDHLEKEMDLVAKQIGRRAKVRQLHWGGGTPTFLNNSQIERLFDTITQHFDVDPSGEIAIEIDPRTIDKDKLRLLQRLGFNRVSMGVQDFDETVQMNINRIQPFDLVKEVDQWCHELKFHSVNFDLVYGLPEQTPKSFIRTVDQVIKLKPDRIALYSFAYVPWLKHHQRKFSPEALPTNDQKLDIFLNARSQLLEAGYQAIAMDHFALADDELAVAFRENRLYRNFMGYTVKPADEFIGMGLTAIGFIENTFVQNTKIMGDYYALLKDNQLPVERGKRLSDDDRLRQFVIWSFMCRFYLDKEEVRQKFHIDFDGYFQDELEHLERCQDDGLIEVQADRMIVTELGKIFIRNICMGFDFYLRQEGAHRQFSKTV